MQRADRVELKDLVESEWRVRVQHHYAYTVWKQYGEYLVANTVQGTGVLVDVLYLGSDPYGRTTMNSRFRTHRYTKTWYIAAVEPNEDLLIMQDSSEPDALYFISLGTGASHPKQHDVLLIAGLARVPSVSGNWLLLISSAVPVQGETSTCLIHWPTGTLAKVRGIPCPSSGDELSMCSHGWSQIAQCASSTTAA